MRFRWRAPSARQLVGEVEVGRAVVAVPARHEREDAEEASFDPAAARTCTTANRLVDERVPRQHGARQLGSNGRACISLDDEEAPRTADVGQQVHGAGVAQVRHGEPRHALERPFDVERREQASGVGQELGASQQPLAVGDVAKARHPPHHLRPIFWGIE